MATRIDIGNNRQGAGSDYNIGEELFNFLGSGINVRSGIVKFRLAERV